MNAVWGLLKLDGKNPASKSWKKVDAALSHSHQRMRWVNIPLVWRMTNVLWKPSVEWVLGHGWPAWPRWITYPRAWREVFSKNFPFHLSTLWKGRCEWVCRAQWLQKTGLERQSLQRIRPGRWLHLLQASSTFLDSNDKRFSNRTSRSEIYSFSKSSWVWF